LYGSDYTSEVKNVQVSHVWTGAMLD